MLAGGSCRKAPHAARVRPRGAGLGCWIRVLTKDQASGPRLRGPFAEPSRTLTCGTCPRTVRKSSWRQRSFASQERSAQSSTTGLGPFCWVMEFGDKRQDIEEAVEMSVVEAQTLFAADAPQHAPAQRPVAKGEGPGGEGLVSEKQCGEARGEERVPRAGEARSRGCVGRAVRRFRGGRTPRRGAAKREGKRRHTSWAPWAVFSQNSRHRKHDQPRKFPYGCTPRRRPFPRSSNTPQAACGATVLEIVRT